MFVPLLRLAGALVLVLIAVRLVEDLGFPAADDAAEDDGPDEPQDAQAASEAFWDAILLVAPALSTAVPIAAVIFVLVQSALAIRAKPEPQPRAIVAHDAPRAASRPLEPSTPREPEEAVPSTALLEKAPVTSVPPLPEQPPVVAAPAPTPLQPAALPQSPIDDIEPADEEASEKRSRDERLLLYGLGALVIVAAILISVAIFIGGEAQF
eukprot:gene19267-19660_t